MQKLILFILLLTIAQLSNAQIYRAEKSMIKFFSYAPVEDITASNDDTKTLMDLGKKEIAFSVPIDQFEFEKSLMKEHFNENYMESHKYPKSTFLGTFSGFDPNKEGEQQASAQGKLKIHGVTKEVQINGTMEKKGEEILLKAKFVVALEDYNIDIPQIVWQNIAEEIEVTVNITYALYKK